MNNTLLQQKYKVLRINLSKLAEELILLNEVHDDVNLSIKQLLLIDNRIVMDDLFSEVRVINNNIQNEISTVVIPMIDSKF